MFKGERQAPRCWVMSRGGGGGVNYVNWIDLDLEMSLFHEEIPFSSYTNN